MNKLDLVVVDELETTLSDIHYLRELMYMIKSKVSDSQWLSAYCSIDEVEYILATALEEYLS